MRELFLLDPEVTFLNHGSFGACPRVVFERYQHWQRELEREPVEFIARRLPGLLAQARAELAAYVGTAAEDVTFVQNATTGVNMAARALGLCPDDEVRFRVSIAAYNDRGDVDRLLSALGRRPGDGDRDGDRR